MQKMVTIKRKASRVAGNEFSFMVSFDNNFIPLTLNPNDVEFLSFMLKQDEDFVKNGETDLPIIIERRSFLDKDEKSVEYVACEFTISNAVFSLKPEPAYKRLLAFLLDGANA